MGKEIDFTSFEFDSNLNLKPQQNSIEEEEPKGIPEKCIKRWNEGKEFFMKWLEEKGCEEIKESERFCPWDISCLVPIKFADGTIIRKYCLFELKRRTCEGNKYKDNIIDFKKYINLKKEQDKEGAWKVFLVNLFVDNCLYINDLEAEHEVRTYNAQKSFLWDRTRVQKEIVSYSHKVCRRFDFEGSID